MMVCCSWMMLATLCFCMLTHCERWMSVANKLHQVHCFVLDLLSRMTAQQNNGSTREVIGFRKIPRFARFAQCLLVFFWPPFSSKIQIEKSKERVQLQQLLPTTTQEEGGHCCHWFYQLRWFFIQSYDTAAANPQYLVITVLYTYIH